MSKKAEPVEVQYLPMPNHTKKEAETFGPHFTAFEAEHGRLPTTDEAIDMARPLDSPMHDGYTWDNDQCGDLYRRKEALDHLRCYQLVYTPGVRRDIAYSLSVPVRRDVIEAAEEQGQSIPRRQRVTWEQIAADPELAHDALAEVFGYVWAKRNELGQFADDHPWVKRLCRAMDEGHKQLDMTLVS